MWDCRDVSAELTCGLLKSNLVPESGARISWLGSLAHSLAFQFMPLSESQIILVAASVGMLLGVVMTWTLASLRIFRLRAELIRLQTHLATLQTARQELSNQFELLAGRIFEDHSEKFSAQSRHAMSEILAPLGVKIVEFREKLELIHSADLQQRSALKQQVEYLAQQSREVGQKADRLADALKGDSKALGNWGELVLERLLETSGLQLGRDYSLQVSVQEPDGRRHQPDAVIHLPENRCLLIDAKMVLKDFLNYSNATRDEDRVAALKGHVLAVEAHLKNLAGKNYPSLDAFRGRTPDFVLMFVPSEPAFTLALSAKPALFESAAHAGVILVGPGGLLATLRLVDQIWRMEKQRSILNDVFDAVRKIYEKYVSFTEDLQRIDDALVKAHESYHQAYQKLATGDGNLLRQMERFRKENLIRPKRLPPKAFQEVDTEPSDTPG